MFASILTFKHFRTTLKWWSIYHECGKSSISSSFQKLSPCSCRPCRKYISQTKSQNLHLTVVVGSSSSLELNKLWIKLKNGLWSVILKYNHNNILLFEIKIFSVRVDLITQFAAWPNKNSYMIYGIFYKIVNHHFWQLVFYFAPRPIFKFWIERHHMAQPSYWRVYSTFVVSLPFINFVFYKLTIVFELIFDELEFAGLWLYIDGFFLLAQCCVISNGFMWFYIVHNVLPN